jgi:hypothetical protein
MTTKRRFRPPHATLVAYVSLFLSLGGTTYAATNIAPGSIGTKQLHDGAVTTSKLAPGAVAPNAIRATNAHHATNADQLGGSPASDYKLHCADGMLRAADLCADFNARAPADLATALSTCALAQMRLPNPGELAVVFNNLGAPQVSQWVASYYSTGTGLSGDMLSNSSSRHISLGFTTVGSSVPYRCVTSASN